MDPSDRGVLAARLCLVAANESVKASTAVRFHDLRHAFGTRCEPEGVPMRMLQEWMGHRDSPDSGFR
jgi:integrase